MMYRWESALIDVFHGVEGEQKHFQWSTWHYCNVTSLEPYRLFSSQAFSVLILVLRASRSRALHPGQPSPERY